MNQKSKLLAVILVLTSFFVCHALAVKYITGSPKNKEQTTSTKPQIKLPDFAKIQDIPTRKNSFFDFLKPMVDSENQRLRKLRSKLADMSAADLQAIAKQYKVPEGTDIKKGLLLRIDEIPASLVLAQAATESAWGTSRFARDGNNLFGEWCYSKGCGIVPQQRSNHLTHEVRRFASPEMSIRSYMNNLNSHKAYQMLRKLRAEQRVRQQPLNGCYLANGLQSYSQKGSAYVKMIKAVIRVNKLEKNRQDCTTTLARST
ncbi:MAG: glycoside hydrolase family 73 [Gammaproteobacteria bacterium]|nr:MAG: glycoside hydrolase family 73 [Gammaproteobacteria bacterium]